MADSTIKPRLDLSGQAFGRLTAIIYIPSGHNAAWLCCCVCGRTKYVRTSHLMSGAVSSCGCFKLERAKLRGTTHGRSNTPEYHSWESMRERCYKPGTRGYAHYGGRGITVCDRWRNSFANFYADMGPRPKGRTLERIKNDSNYEPGNCRWATRTDQARNRSSNRFLTHGRKTLAIWQWAELTGIQEATIRARMNRGWDPQRILTTPTWTYHHRRTS